MEIPENIKQTLQQIRESEDVWKSYYMAVWGHSGTVEGMFKGTFLWANPLTLGLPASKRKSHTFKSGESLHYILTHRDADIALNHTQTMFSLLENLIKEINRVIYPEKPEINAGSKKVIMAFLKGERILDKDGNVVHDYTKIKPIIKTIDEEREFILARETRNCVIHNGRKVDRQWAQAFKDARGYESPYKIGEMLNLIATLEQVEDWHENIFLKTVNDLEKFLVDFKD